MKQLRKSNSNLKKLEEVTKIVNAIISFTHKIGGAYIYFYAGLTNNPLLRRKKHIFEGRCSRYTIVKSIKCSSNEIARQVEEILQKKYGMAGYNNNPMTKGNEDSVYVYCFKMTDCFKITEYYQHIFSTLKFNLSFKELTENFKKFSK